MLPCGNWLQAAMRNLLSWAFPGTLHVEKGRLYGKIPFGRYERIEPANIVEAAEYGWNNPMFLLKTPRWTYKARPWSKDYERIISWVEKETDSDISNRPTHAWNSFLFGPWFGRGYRDGAPNDEKE